MRKLSELDYFELLLLNGHHGILYPSIQGTTYVRFEDAEGFEFDDKVILLKPGEETTETYRIHWTKEAPLNCYVEALTIKDSYMVILAVEPFTKETGTDVILMSMGDLNAVLEA